MKLSQEKPKFEPITIILETQEEAKVFFGLVDKIDIGRTNLDYLTVSRSEADTLIAISDSLTNCKVTI